MVKSATFDDFWADVNEELAQYAPHPVLQPLPRFSTENFSVYWVKLTSIGPYRIGGYYSVPSGEGPFPALMNTPRYGSVNHVPTYNDRLRYAVLTLMHRGQRLADQPFQAAYPGLLTTGIDSAETYAYRGIVADCVRGAEFLLGRNEVDLERVAIVGDDLALITAAMRPGFKYVQVAGLMFYRLMEARRQTSAYPIEEINDHLRSYPEQEQAVADVLSFFDPIHHASRINGTVNFSVGDEGAMGGPEWLEPLISKVGGEVEEYRLTHEGGTDHDQLDALLAAQLSTEPMSKFQRTYR